MRPADHILVHFGPEESWVGVSLHEAVDFSLDLIEAVWGWILQALLDLLPGALVNVHLQELKGETLFLKGEKALGPQHHSKPRPKYKLL